ncbi:WD-40 repeat-containing protein [Phellopilus nigrolimitatus]|nr:WD-40 repeat-containing protein [Phellopilus nigrolimitatus]
MFSSAVLTSFSNILDENRKTSQTTASSRQRIGKCIVFKVCREQDGDILEVLQELEMPAILDMKWSSCTPTLAIADSEGHVSLKRLTSEKLLQEVQDVQCRPTDTLCLSLDWSDKLNSNEVGSIAVSCSDGSLSVLKPDSDGDFIESASWHAHDFEAWITAWNYWDTNTIYSGGDDLKLKGWDIRLEPSSPTFVNKRFEGGVTSIQCHPHVEHIIAVGSYDSVVRIFDVRKPLAPVTQAEVGGGAWRVKWHPSKTRDTDLLVACMHDGFKIVRFSPSIIAGGIESNATKEWEIVKRYDEHGSLAYGVDWAHAALNGRSLIASCSFYDHVLHTWEG